MAASRSPTALLATLGFATLGFATAPMTARADEPGLPLEPVHVPAAEILAGLDRAEDAEDGWLSVHLDRMNVNKKFGLTYTRSVGAGDKRMSFSVGGPVLRKDLRKRRNVGLSIEIRF